MITLLAYILITTFAYFFCLAFGSFALSKIHRKAGKRAFTRGTQLYVYVVRFITRICMKWSVRITRYTWQKMQPHVRSFIRLLVK